jgi:hypothetical protein
MKKKVFGLFGMVFVWGAGVSRTLLASRISVGGQRTDY